MKKCQLCGKECDDNATVCEECASSVLAPQPIDKNPKPKKATNFALTAAILGIVFPLIAIVPIFVAIAGIIFTYIASLIFRFISIVILVVPIVGLLILFPLLSIIGAAAEIALATITVLLPLLISLLLITAALALSIIALTKKQKLGIAGIVLSSLSLVSAAIAITIIATIALILIAVWLLAVYAM